MEKRFNVVSLFSGAGGFDLGFKQAGYNILWANDIDINSCKTYIGHSPETRVACKNISEVKSEEIPDCDLIIGGFPCQGFSMRGKRNILDHRNYLYKEYVRIVKDKMPLCFVGENVQGLLSMDRGEFIKKIMQDFSECGYNVFCQLVNSKDYGVPQSRNRIFIFGFRKDLDIAEFFLPKYEGKIITLRDAIGHLPEPESKDVCSQKFSNSYLSTNKKREWDNVSYTILAKADSIPLHPSSPDRVKNENEEWEFKEGKARRLSYKECALIQTFPEHIIFYGGLISKYRQIGNAVPPKLALFIAEYLYMVLREKI